MSVEPIRMQPRKPTAPVRARRRGRGRSPGRVQGRAYSRFVHLMKVVLPMIAVGILGLLVAWPGLQDTIPEPAVRDGGALEMAGAQYLGIDGESRPFSIRAERAVRSPQNAAVMDLVDPEAEMTRADGSWVTIRAERGRYNEETGKLLLLDHVNLFHDAGYEFLTDEAHIDTVVGNAWGDRPVTGQGPVGEVFGQGFRLYDSGRTIVVTGPARLNLVGNSATEVTQ